MTYSTGGLIQATDYNAFATSVNSVWNTLYGQTAVPTVSAGTSTVSATQWATLFTTISSTAAHQGTTITALSNPTAGQTIAYIAAVNNDITNITATGNVYNAASSGSQYTAWTGTNAQTASTGSGGAAWTLTFTNTVTFANATAATSFFSAGGYLKIQVGKTSTGTVADTEWNAFIGNGTANGVVGTIYLTATGASKTIAGSTFTGTTKVGGSGTPSVLATTTGYAQLTSTPTTIYKQFDSGAAYSSNYVQINASQNGSGVLTITTTWVDVGDANPGSTTQITGGTAGTGATFGTAPETLVTYYAPESTNVSNTWGTPTVVASVVAA